MSSKISFRGTYDSYDCLLCVFSEGKRKRKRKNKCLVELPNTNRVDALDGDNDEG